MKILCAWSLKEGKRGLMGKAEPLDDPTETHGICPEHRLQVEEEIELLRRTSGERLEALRKHNDEELDPLRKKVDPQRRAGSRLRRCRHA